MWVWVTSSHYALQEEGLSWTEAEVVTGAQILGESWVLVAAAKKCLYLNELPLGSFLWDQFSQEMVGEDDRGIPVAKKEPEATANGVMKMC